MQFQSVADSSPAQFLCVLLFEPDIRRSVELNLILTQHGYAVSTVITPTDLMDCIAAGGFDAVLVPALSADHQSPGSPSPTPWLAVSAEMTEAQLLRLIQQATTRAVDV